MGEALGIVAFFVAGGLALAASFEEAGPTPRLGRYAPEMGVSAEPEPARTWLVDGYNVLNVALLAGRSREGWWSSQHREELLGRIADFEVADAEIWVVFDGAQPPAAPGSGRVRSVFAPDADEWLLSRIRGGPGPVVLVTADRRLAARARRRGAEVMLPSEFLARCGGLRA